MISLFLDTCNLNVIIAILKDKQVIYSKIIENKNDLSEKLLPIIKDGIESINLNIHDVKKIFVANGPGSFTGIRIGVTVAKVLAWTMNIDIVPVSSLEVLATTNTEKKYLCPIIDARRGYVYTGLYDNELNVIIENKYTKLEDFISNLKYNKEDILFISYDNLLEQIVKPSYDINKLINKHFEDLSLNPHEVNPIYLKLTEAEEKLNDKRN